MAHEHPIEDDEVVEVPPTDVPPVPGPPPGLEDDGVDDATPINLGVMHPE
jgi:hypothetical protein